MAKITIEIKGVGFEQENRLQYMQMLNNADTKTLKIFTEVIKSGKEKKLQNNWSKLKIFL